MRIISQDGTMDFEYESITLQVVDNEIKAYDSIGDDCIMATYKTEDEALLAMKILHNAFTKVHREKTDKGYEFYILPKVWQFPQAGNDMRG